MPNLAELLFYADVGFFVNTYMILINYDNHL